MVTVAQAQKPGLSISTKPGSILGERNEAGWKHSITYELISSDPHEGVRAVDETEVL